MTVVEAAIAVVSGLSVLCFALYLWALFHMPTGQRPKTPMMNRFGEPLPASENPGYQETEEEVHS